MTKPNDELNGMPEYIWAEPSNEVKVWRDFCVSKSAVKYIRADLSPPVPDDVTVPREVLQGVRETLKDCGQYLGDKYYAEYTPHLADKCNESAATLDAVLAEGSR